MLKHQPNDIAIPVDDCVVHCRKTRVVDEAELSHLVWSKKGI